MDNKIFNLYSINFYLPVKKNETLTFIRKLLEVENTTLGEITWPSKTVCVLSHWSLPLSF